MNLPFAVGGGVGWPLPPTRNKLWLAAPPAGFGSTSVEADQLLAREELRYRAKLEEIANAPAPAPLGLQAKAGHGTAHGAGHTSLEEGDEILEDEEEEEEEEEELNEEELLVDQGSDPYMFEEEAMGSLDVTGEDLLDLP